MHILKSSAAVFVSLDVKNEDDSGASFSRSVALVSEGKVICEVPHPVIQRSGTAKSIDFFNWVIIIG